MKKVYSMPILKKIGGVSKVTAGSGRGKFDNGHDASSGKS